MKFVFEAEIEDASRIKTISPLMDNLSPREKIQLVYCTLGFVSSAILNMSDRELFAWWSDIEADIVEKVAE